MDLRCGWCSLSSVDENPVDPVSGLCSACVGILGDANWQCLLDGGFVYKMEDEPIAEGDTPAAAE